MELASSLLRCCAGCYQQQAAAKPACQFCIKFIILFASGISLFVCVCVCVCVCVYNSIFSLLLAAKIIYILLIAPVAHCLSSLAPCPCPVCSRNIFCSCMAKGRPLFALVVAVAVTVIKRCCLPSNCACYHGECHKTCIALHAIDSDNNATSTEKCLLNLWPTGADVVAVWRAPGDPSVRPSDCPPVRQGQQLALTSQKSTQSPVAFAAGHINKSVWYILQKTKRNQKEKEKKSKTKISICHSLGPQQINLAADWRSYDDASFHWQPLDTSLTAAAANFQVTSPSTDRASHTLDSSQRQRGAWVMPPGRGWPAWKQYAERRRQKAEGRGRSKWSNKIQQQ